MFLQGLKALHSPHTGIVDWGEVTRSYAKNFQSLGGTIYLNFPVSKFEETTTDPDHPVTVIGKNAVSQFYSDDFYSVLTSCL